jgi:peptidyl-tRNA hydrolase
VDAICTKWGVTLNRQKQRAACHFVAHSLATATPETTKRVILAQPQTFMNLSGRFLCSFPCGVVYVLTNTLPKERCER